MDLTPYVSTLREDLTTAASAGDEQTRRTAAVLSATLEPATRLAIMNALSDLAAEVTASLDGPVVEVRLDGRDVRVVVTGGSAPDHEPDDRVEDDVPPPSMGDATGDISRITLRLLEELKSQAEKVAAAEGISLNTFVSQAVQGAVHGRRKGRGRGGPWGQGAGLWGGGSGGPGAQWAGQNWGNWGTEQRGGGGSRGGSRVRGWVEG